MKICPACNESFPDELNFCDVDGTRLAREDSPQERNKWWSLLGAGLLVAAVLISAASIIFLPRARVSPVVVNPEPQQSITPPATPSSDNAGSVAQSATTAEPEQVPADALAPELKKREKEFANGNSGEAPNPKAAALAAEGVKDSAAIDSKKNETPPPKTEPTLPISSVSDPRTPEAAPKPPPPAPEVKKDHHPQPTPKISDKEQNGKKKDDEKKKGGFLRVFKKIFGKE